MSDTLTLALVILEGIGVLAFAASGVLAGATKRLDVVGVAVIAFLTAFGGGTLRDVLLDRGPFFWVANEGWVWAVLVLAIVGPVFLRAQHIEPTAKAMQWPDAVGLGLFAASGTQVALESGASPLISTLMGVVTAVFGGMIRDIWSTTFPGWSRAISSMPSLLLPVGGLSGVWEHSVLLLW